MADNEVKAEFKKLKNMVKLLANGMPKVRVGILGDTAQRNSGGPNNAEIGYVNEFGKMTGYPRIPARSFIRMPLNLFFREKLKEKKSLGEKQFLEALESGKADEFMAKVGLVAEETIQEAFATHGFGMWSPNAPYTVEMKKSDSPLIDTGQLRRAITSKVIKNDHN